MSDSTPPDASDKKPRRLRPSKRLVAAAVAAAFLISAVIWGVDKWQAHRRAQAIAAVVEVGGAFTHRSQGQASRVYFAGPAFDDAKLAWVVEHLELLRPHRIDFDQCPITDDGLVHLERLETARIIFVHETKATAKGIERLQAALPDATIRTTKPDPTATNLLARNVYPHAVNHVAYSPGGETLVAGDGRGMLYVTEARTGSVAKRIQAHDAWLFRLAYSPNGELVASGGGDGVIRLWNTNTWKLHAELRGHTDDVHGVAFSPDGRRLVSCGDDHAVLLWNLEKRTIERTLVGHQAAVTSVAFSPDGALVASTSRDHMVRIWPVESTAPPRVLGGHRADVMNGVWQF